jgi:putative transposase
MRKLTDERKLLWCLRQFREQKESEKWLSSHLGISTRRFRQLYSIYKQTQDGSLPKPKMGRPRKTIPEQWKEIVKIEWEKQRVNALYLERVIAVEHKIRIPHNTIHKIMLEKGYAAEQKSKKKRRKPWIRYERKHSLSAVHMDWHINTAVPDKQVCVVLDDASRKVLSGGEFDNATEENSVLLLKEALETCRAMYNLGIRECISDHGTQFYADKRDKQGKADHAFEGFLKVQGVRQILCRVKHPQTNGKEEKWFDFYENHRGRYNSIGNLIEWYNNRMHGSLNMRFAETPNQAFIRKMPPECWMWLAKEIFEW